MLFALFVLSIFSFLSKVVVSEEWLLKKWVEEKDKGGRKPKRVDEMEAWEKETKELEEFEPMGGF